jgi:hypothetical protein
LSPELLLARLLAACSVAPPALLFGVTVDMAAGNPALGARWSNISEAKGVIDMHGV